MLPGLQPSGLPADAVEVGLVLGAWGIKGWLKISPHSASSEALFSCPRWFLQPPSPGKAKAGFAAFSGTALLTISEVKVHSAGVVAKAEDVDDRDVAQALRGARIFLPRSSFPKLATDEYYWVDLIGLEVVNREGVALGVVRELMSTGPHAVLCVQYELADATQAERMIPFVAAYVDAVDVSVKRITVDWQPDY